MKIVSGEDLFKLEPNLNEKARFALFAPSAGIISSYEFTIALADSAVINGVKIYLDTELIDIETENRRVLGVKTSRGLLRQGL